MIPRYRTASKIPNGGHSLAGCGGSVIWISGGFGTTQDTRERDVSALHGVNSTSAGSSLELGKGEIRTRTSRSPHRLHRMRMLGLPAHLPAAGCHTRGAIIPTLRYSAGRHALRASRNFRWNAAATAADREPHTAPSPARPRQPWLHPPNVLGVSCTAGSACRSRSGAAVAADELLCSEWRPAAAVTPSRWRRCRQLGCRAEAGPCRLHTKVRPLGAAGRHQSRCSRGHRGLLSRPDRIDSQTSPQQYARPPLQLNLQAA
jgi:hypothetical protein